MMTTHIMKPTGMHGYSESIMPKYLVLIQMLLVEMRFAEWNSCGLDGLGQSLDTDMVSGARSCLKLVLYHLLMSTLSLDPRHVNEPADD